jgi:UPF0755 protein
MRNLVFLFVFTAVAILIWGTWEVFSFNSRGPSQNHSEVIFEVQSGESFVRVANRLESEGLISDAFRFRILARVLQLDSKVKVGEYVLYKDQRPQQILDVICSGKSRTLSLIVPEGFNIYEINDQLEKIVPGRGKEFLQLALDGSVATAKLGFVVPSYEGFLFPDTYEITRKTSAAEVIDMMFSRFQAEFRAARVTMAIPMDELSHVTMASMIEKETGAGDERPMISSVFHNRLKKKMRLQSDPTIIYGIWLKIGERPLNIRKADILSPSEYNTYVIPAIPKAPIANPGKKALIAAVNPDVSNNLFFVSKNDGTHEFTTNYADHSRAVQKFQVDRRAREGKSWRDLNK